MSRAQATHAAQEAVFYDRVRVCGCSLLAMLLEAVEENPAVGLRGLAASRPAPRRRIAP